MGLSPRISWGFDPFLVELEAGGHCEEVAVLRGVDLALVGGLDLAPICWLLVFFFFFWLIVGVGRWVLILIGLFFLVHWWVLMILPPFGWVMIWLDWVFRLGG